MRSLEVIGSELRLLQAIRRAVRETEDRTPSTAHIDELLDERWDAPAKCSTCISSVRIE
jgi:hypothetical protein